MKTYRVGIVTSYYKMIDVKAENEDDAGYKALEWLNTNDTVSGAQAQFDIYELEEVAE